MFRDERDALEAKVRAQEAEIDSLRKKLAEAQKQPRPESSTVQESAVQEIRSRPPDRVSMDAAEPNGHLPWWGWVIGTVMFLVFAFMSRCDIRCTGCLPREPLTHSAPAKPGGTTAGALVAGELRWRP